MKAKTENVSNKEDVPAFARIASLWMAKALLKEPTVLSSWERRRKKNKIHIEDKYIKNLDTKLNPIFSPSVPVSDKQTILKVSALILKLFVEKHKKSMEFFKEVANTQTADNSIKFILKATDEYAEMTIHQISEVVFFAERSRMMGFLQELPIWSTALFVSPFFFADSQSRKWIASFIRLTMENFISYWDAAVSLEKDKDFVLSLIPKNKKNRNLELLNQVLNREIMYCSDKEQKEKRKFPLDPSNILLYSFIKSGICPDEFYMKDISFLMDDAADALAYGICVAEPLQNGNPPVAVLSSFEKQNHASQADGKILRYGIPLCYMETKNSLADVSQEDKTELKRGFLFSLFVQELITAYKEAVIQQVKNGAGANTKRLENSLVKEFSKLEDENNCLRKQIVELQEQLSELQLQTTVLKDKLLLSQQKNKQLLESLSTGETEKTIIEPDSISTATDLAQGEQINEADTETTVEKLQEIYIVLSDFFEKNRTVLVGGHPNLVSRFSQKYPQVSCLPLNRIASCDAKIKNAKIILFKTNFMNHSVYGKVKAIANRNSIPFYHVPEENSLEHIEKSIYEWIIQRERV